MSLDVRVTPQAWTDRGEARVVVDILPGGVPIDAGKAAVEPADGASLVAQ